MLSRSFEIITPRISQVVINHVNVILVVHVATVFPIFQVQASFIEIICVTIKFRVIIVIREFVSVGTFAQSEVISVRAANDAIYLLESYQVWSIAVLTLIACPIRSCSAAVASCPARLV